MKQGTLITKIVMIILLVGVAIYLAIYAVRSLSDPFTTAMAYQDSLDDSVEVTGVLVREEIALSSGTAIMDILPEEGERVRAGETVAILYQSGDALDRKKQLQALEQEGSPSLDRTADTFARILAAAALPAESSARTRALEQLLYHVGRWIYLVDAWDDLEEDGRTGSYNPIAARFPEQVEANRDYLRTTLLHSLNLARSACALLELGHWQGAVENILYLGLPMVEELVFTGRWKAVNHQNRRRIS